MCGIAGLWSRNTPLPRQDLERFTNALAHRGPDGSGFLYSDDQKLGLGHRRLSILDPDPRSAQPFNSEHLTIVYNGEIYNFLELRRELEGLGHHFHTTGDTEVLLAAYRQWGPDCQSRLNGMWAFAIYDKRQRSLFFSRDRYGIKPLFYAHLPNGTFAFASETLAFRQLPGYRRTFDAENLARCIADSRSLAGGNDTIFKDISQLPPAHCATLSADGTMKVRRWWNHRGEIDLPTKPKDRIARFSELLSDACRLRLRSDAPLATALSGGMDSSSVYAKVGYLLKGERPERGAAATHRAYCLGFPGSPRDERSAARLVADFTGGDLKEVIPSYGTDEIISATRQFDTVFSDPNFIVRQLYEAMAADGFKVSMDGHGVDELLFGYPGMVDELLPWAAREKPGYARDLKALRSKMTVFTPRSGLRHAIRELRKRYAKVSGPVVPPTKIIDKYMFGTYLPAILRNFDRASMAAGVEIRTPFLDYRLVEFCLALPVQECLSGSYTKLILRKAMKGALPQEICWTQKKVGLQAPMDQLLNGPLNAYVLDMLHSEAFLSSDYWDGKKLAGELAPKLKAKQSRQGDGYRIWPLLSALLIDDQG